MANSEATYVYQDTEVKLTGRRATKGNVRQPTAELVEITPSDENNGTWKKWVPRVALFEIQPD